MDVSTSIKADVSTSMATEFFSYDWLRQRFVFMPLYENPTQNSADSSWCAYYPRSLAAAHPLQLRWSCHTRVSANERDTQDGRTLCVRVFPDSG